MVRISLVFAEDMTASGEARRRVTRESMGYPGYPGYHSSKDPQMIGSPWKIWKSRYFYVFVYPVDPFLNIFQVFQVPHGCQGHIPGIPAQRLAEVAAEVILRSEITTMIWSRSEDFRHIFSMKHGRNPWRLGGFWALKLWTSHLIKNMFAILPGARYHSKWVNMTHFMGGNSLFLY